MKRLAIILLALALLALLGIAFFQSNQPAPVSADIVDLQAAGDTSGFARAEQPRAFSFPLDHGPHPEYQTEWWYYTGNLEAADGHHFGFQLTFFRRAIAPQEPPRSSDWATNQIYFAHLAITDVKGNMHFAAERFSRGAAGLAGATGNPYHVWLENWDVSSLSPDGSSVRLQARDSNNALDLTLTSVKPPVLQGDHGLSAKSSEPGDASYYYSFTRLVTQGTIEINGQSLNVRGLAWMDHEFGTTFLGASDVGWDWFSIQLSDQREIMFYQIRLKDGRIEPASSGTLIEPDGTTKQLPLDQVQLRTLAEWTSPVSHATYPARWALSIPSEGTQLDLRPYIADQEMRVSILYWEGAVEVTGQSAGKPVSGNGYVEMTGYAPHSTPFQP